VLVQPATVERWHRDRCDRRWWRRSRCPGRPRIDAGCRDLISRLAEENAPWGAPRIHGELLKLKVIVSERTVSRYFQERLKRPSEPGARSWQIASASSHSIPACCHRTPRTLMTPTCPACHVANRGCHAMRCTHFIRAQLSIGGIRVNPPHLVGVPSKLAWTTASPFETEAGAARRHREACRLTRPRPETDCSLMLLSLHRTSPRDHRSLGRTRPHWATASKGPTSLVSD
jgi:hypothetical protein